MSTVMQFPALRDTSPQAHAATPPTQRVQQDDSPQEDATFSREQIREFQADDAAAMGTIAKIMTTLFTYTVVIMSVVILWTFAVVS